MNKYVACRHSLVSSVRKLWNLMSTININNLMLHEWKYITSAQVALDNSFNEVWILAKKQTAQLSQRDRVAGWVSFGKKWKTGTGRQYFTDIIAISNHCDIIGLQNFWTISCDNSETVRDRMAVRPTIIGSRIRAFDWYRPRWPWMTLNAVIALILRFYTQFDCFAGQLRHSGWR